jgi:D-alanyl-lipoteichoic acid acyltransferase DltB (MBOAT superfamily)
MTGFAIIRGPFYALQQSHYMVIKAQSPAGFAEEYIIESIWNNRFPPGSILPAGIFICTFKNHSPIVSAKNNTINAIMK